MATLIIIMSISRDSGKTIAKYMYIKKRLNIQSKLAILNLNSQTCLTITKQSL